VNFRRTVGAGLGAGGSVGLSEGFADAVAVTDVDGVGVGLDAVVIGHTVWCSVAESVAERVAVAAL
jgi:hypothetical protein